MINGKQMTVYDMLRQMRTLKRPIFCLVDKKYINLA